MKDILGAQPYFGSAVGPILRDVKSVLKTGQLTQGPHLEAFEKEFSRFTGTRYAAGVHSGGSGLELIVRALDLQGGEIIVPTNTFVASASSVILGGGKVVFADINRDTLALDIKSIENRITPRTRGIMIVYMFGIIPGYMNSIKALCRKHGLFLIEDAAHAHGASYKNAMAGSIGNAACFSFYATKVITTGEGGVITTNDKDLYKKILMLRNHGKSLEGDTFELVSNNYRLAEIPSILGRHQLSAMEKNIRRRNEIAAYYTHELRGVEEIQLLSQSARGLQHSYWRFPVLLKNPSARKELQKLMAGNHGVRITWMYEPLCHLQPLFRKSHRHRKGDFPVAEYCMERLICLPTHLALSDNDLKRVTNALKKELPGCR